VAGVTAAAVRIVRLPAEAILALADGDLAGADAASPVPLTDWMVSEGSVRTWQYRAVQAIQTPEDLPWITGVLWDDEAQTAVGQTGFHAAPDADGMVEIGYGVDPARTGVAAMPGRHSSWPSNGPGRSRQSARCGPRSPRTTRPRWA
jgi:hypothetical protein